VEITQEMTPHRPHVICHPCVTLSGTEGSQGHATHALCLCESYACAPPRGDSLARFWSHSEPSPPLSLFAVSAPSP